MKFAAANKQAMIDRNAIFTDIVGMGFREGVKQSIEVALEKGIHDEAVIDALVGQICYWTADLSFRLKQNGERLEQYSEELRREF